MNIYLQNLQQQITYTASRIKNKNIKDRSSVGGENDFNGPVSPTKIDTKNYSLLDSTSHYLLLKNKSVTSSIDAARSYKKSDYKSKGTIAEGLVFKYNREFNFKV